MVGCELAVMIRKVAQSLGLWYMSYVAYYKQERCVITYLLRLLEYVVRKTKH